MGEYIECASKCGREFKVLVDPEEEMKWHCEFCTNELMESTVIHICDRLRMAAEFKKEEIIMQEEVGDIDLKGWIIKTGDYRLIKTMMRGLSHTTPTEVKAWIQNE